MSRVSPPTGEPLTGTIADPEFRRARAAKAGRAAHSLTRLVRQVIENIEELTDEEIEQLRAVLPPKDSK